ncbi:DUF5703 domain-containing protein [Ferruginibacter albus]|uniref:DUF5703 domain-containing protein n=1 Tax=Ferruginibacter albus TaxID=2875540 RepID=UPI001CC5BBAB|nr:DUF5703 domain-containing protein [Ferruginibacter albus]UAY50847.1 DUF5703 domain-containing protein [Ferruginibacter albus]
MKKYCLLFFFIGLISTTFGQRIDVALLNKYNVSWDEPGPTSYQSMPIGNGDIGLNVWTEANGDISFYISKTDAWGEEVKDRGDWMKQGGVLMKLGLVRISVVNNHFKKGDYFRQILKLHESELLITEGTGNNAIDFKIWVDANNPVIRIEQASGYPVSLKVTLDNWRTNGEGDTVLNKSNCIQWYHHNSEKADSALRNIVFGATIDGRGLVKTDKSTLQSSHASVNQVISIYPLTQNVNTPDNWISTNDQQVINLNKTNTETARKAHYKWWDDFWNRSWIFIEGDSIATKTTEGYLLQRYVTACSGRGAYPVKFNGSIFNVDNPDYNGRDKNQPLTPMNADFREWGGQYWFQNTRPMYWPRLQAGDFDIMLPLFKMYANMIKANEPLVRKYYDHAGSYFAETSPFWGGLLYMGPEVKENWTGHYFTPVLELSMMAFDYFEYTQDTAFAKNILLPIASNGILFFDKHFGRDSSGKLLLDPDNSIEMFWKVHNPAPDIAGLHAVLSRLIALPGSLINEQQRKEWIRFQNELPPLPVGTKEGAQVLLPYTGPQIIKSHNAENPELYAIYPFRLYGLGKPDLELAKNTFAIRKFKEKGCWFQDPVQAAMLGLAETAKDYITFNLTRKAPGLKFPAFWDVGADYLPDEDNGGNGENGLQQMLLQTDGKKIMILPAWPKEWNANFKLNAPYKTTIEGKVRNGKLEEIKVIPEYRRQDVIINE